MELRNNNREIIYTIAQAGYKKNKSRNRLMIGAAALTVIIIFSVFSIMKGRIDAEYLSEVRHMGHTASTFLEDPTTAQIEEIKSLYYIKDVGAINQFAVGNADGRSIFICVTAEDYAFENIFLPAYTDVYGHYPEKDNEIMLPIRALEEMLIQNPELGMELTFEIYIDRGKSETKTFILSGYYTEYVHPIEGAPIGFFTEGYLNHLGYDMEHPTALFIRQNNLFAGEKVEEMLYRDIETKNDVQRFNSENSANYNVIRATVGGYDVALLCIMLIVVCVFLLNYNVMNLSLNRDVRHYGLLKTLGATNRQIRRTIYWQMLKICTFGIIIGAIVSIGVVLFLLPALLSNYYINNFGVSSKMMTFSPVLMLIAVMLALLISFVSILGPARKAGKIAPVESMKYVGNQKGSQKQFYKGKKGTDLAHMAWRNICRNRRSTVITILSLFLGLSAALSSLVIVTGLDYTNNFELFPDFELEAHYNPQWADNYDKTFYSVTSEDLDYMSSLDGVEQMDVIYVDYILLNPDEKVWEPFLKGNYLMESQQEKFDEKEYVKTVKENFYSTIIVADEAFLNELEQYVIQNEIPIDIEGLKAGTSVICTSGQWFSKKILDSSQSVIGESFEIKTSDGEHISNMEFGGYIDVSKEGCPSKHTGIMLNGPDLMISEKAFEQMGLSKRAAATDLHVDDQKEPMIKKKLNMMMEKKRAECPPSEQDMKMPYLGINSEHLAEALDEINTMQTVMYTVSILLILLGLFNYFNATASSLLSRRNEIAVMESIGITRKQLRKMLVTEGIFFSTIVSGLIGSAGSGILILLFQVLKSRLGYAKFYFPYVGMGVVIVMLFIICIMIPLVLYRQIANESVIERLRVNGE